MAVFTPVSDEDARVFLNRYDLGAFVSLDGVAEGVENSNFRLVTTAGTFALTLFEKRVSPQDLPYYLGLMEHLARRGIPSPLPRRDRSGELIGDLNGRRAAIVDWLPGAWLRAPTMDDVRQAGRVLAQLHLAAADFPLQLPNAMGLASWTRLAERCAERASGESAAMLEVLAAEIDRLRRLWPSGLPSGPIHADLFPDNVLFDQGRVSGVIDYYFACNDAWAYDLAVTINAWGFTTSGEPEPVLSAALIEGYESVRRLTPEEIAAMPILAAGSAVRFSLSRLHDQLFHDPSWKVTPKDPTPFVRRVQYHQRARGLAVA
jgi:homoserine kinase type II